MPRRPQPSHLEAWRGLLTAHRRLVDLLEQDLQAGHQLSLSEYEVLMNVASGEGGHIRMGEVARRLLVTAGGVTRIADRLERDGLLRRQASPGDRRRVELVLTAEGRRRVRAAARDHLRGIEEHFARHLSKAEAVALHETLSRMIQATGPAAGPHAG